MRKISINLPCPTEIKQQVNSVITWTGEHTIICKPKANKNIVPRSRLLNYREHLSKTWNMVGIYRYINVGELIKLKVNFELCLGVAS